MKIKLLNHTLLVHFCLFSVSGWFWSRSGLFFRFSSSYHSEENRKKTKQNGSKTTQKPRRYKNEQVTYDLTVLFSLIFVLNLRDWVTCGDTKGGRLRDREVPLYLSFPDKYITLLHWLQKVVHYGIITFNCCKRFCRLDSSEICCFWANATSPAKTGRLKLSSATFCPWQLSFQSSRVGITIILVGLGGLERFSDKFDCSQSIFPAPKSVKAMVFYFSVKHFVCTGRARAFPPK